MTVRVDERSCVIEPVHWASRLARTPGVLYTEVAGIPCLVRASDGRVKALTPTWAAIWAQLDGRPVTEALSIEPDTLDPVDTRNLVEVLRRLKGMEVVCDADPTSPPRPADLGSPAAPGGSVKIALSGSIHRDRDRVELAIEPGSTERAVVKLTDAVGAVRVTTRRRLRTRRVDHIALIDSTAPDADQVAAGSFASIIKAVDDPSVLVTPGLVDLLAGLAERATAPGSPRH